MSDIAQKPRVLVTGGAGFIGSHLAEALLEEGYLVTVIDDLSTGRFENIAHLTSHPNFHFAIDSILNEVVVDRLVSESQVIFHLAAAVGVQLIVSHPVGTITANVMGTEAVLRAAMRYRVKVLVASSSEVYGKGNQVPFSEEDDVLLGPTSKSRWSYAASKMMAEFMALAYHHERDLPVVIFRLFNTVGPRQTGRYGMVIPRFVEQALRGECLTVYGDGRQSRCFLHVWDAVRALIGLANHPQAIGKVFNLGSVREVSILELARMVLVAAGQEPEEERIAFIPYEQAYMPGFEDMRRRVPDIRRIQQVTGWKPEIDLEQTLAEIVQSARKSVRRD